MGHLAVLDDVSGSGEEVGMFYAVNVLIAAYFALWADSLGIDVAYWPSMGWMSVAFFALWDEYRRGKC